MVLGILKNFIIYTQQSRAKLHIFCKYFSRILPGGAASGFKHVTDEFHPALYSVKGKRNPVVRQLAEVSWSLMNEGDVFVLDCKKYIFGWVGRSANNMEKMHAAKV